MPIDVTVIDVSGNRFSIIEDNYYIHMFDNRFNRIFGYTIKNNYGLHLGVHYGDIPYGNEYEQKVWSKYASGKCWIVSEKMSGNAIGIGRTLEQSIENAIHMIDVLGGVDGIKELANRSIQIYGIAPGFSKNNRY